MGETASDDIRISASPQHIFEVITDLEAYPDWAEGIRAVEVLSRDEADRPVQARFHVDARVMEVTYVLEYEYDEPAWIGWRLVEGHQVRQLDGTYDLQADGDDTHVHYQLEVDVDLPLPRFLKKRAAKVILETGLKGLRERVEEVH